MSSKRPKPIDLLCPNDDWLWRQLMKTQEGIALSLRRSRWPFPDPHEEKRKQKAAAEKPKQVLEAKAE